MSGRRVELTVATDVAAAAGAVWDAVTDWPRQGEWMLATTVRVEGGGDGRRPGARLSALTGLGRFGVTDRMEIVEWEPPRRCVVRHLGRLIRGEGVVEVLDLAPERARLLWTERLELPLGALGRVGWPLVRPALRLGVLWSLRRLARQTAARHRAGGARG